MGVKDRLDFTFLTACEEDLREVFQIYLEDINQLIVQFEITKNEFQLLWRMLSPCAAAHSSSHETVQIECLYLMSEKSPMKSC